MNNETLAHALIPHDTSLQLALQEEVERLRAQAEEHLAAAKAPAPAPSTPPGTSSVPWYTSLRLTPLSGRPEVVAAYLTARELAWRKLATLRVELAAITDAHAQASVEEYATSGPGHAPRGSLPSRFGLIGG